MKSYQSHLVSTDSQKKNLNKKKPVLRSSAIFPFMINKYMDTKILFLGYWLIKRNIKEVKIKIKLKSQNGKLIKSQIKIINQVKAFSISVKKLLNQKNISSTIIGSIELEFFSKVDMVFPYPALVVNFEGKNSSTVVHTCGRIYNNKEDLKSNNKFKVAEAGIDILPNKNFKPFFSFVNGKNKIFNEKISIQIINSNGEILSKQIKFDNIKPYETKFIYFLNNFEKKFLKNKKGTVKIKHNFSNFFPRFVSGNIENSKNNSTLTHTYYDTSKQNDNTTFWINPNTNKFFDSSVSFPLFKDKNTYTELVVYPNFPKWKLSFDLEIYSKMGKLKKKIKSVFKINKKLTKPIYLNINDFLEKSKNKFYYKDNHFVKLIANGNGKVPARLKFGLNLGYKKKYDIPSNICFNAHVPNEQILLKPGTFKWGPLLNKFQSIFTLSNTSNLLIANKNANIIMKFWNEINKKYIIKKITINDNGSYWFDLSKHVKIKKFLGNKTGWVTIQSDNPFVNGWYIEKSKDGIIGADHLF
tara:strand:- start:741 stop:2318 length:1578 start_codon:yes stop_codon:yes gene_type:complete